MPGAQTVIAFPVAAEPHVPPTPDIRAELAWQVLKAAETTIEPLTAPALIDLIEQLRGALSDMLRLDHGPQHDWRLLWSAEEANLATMPPGDLQVLAGGLRGALRRHFD